MSSHAASYTVSEALLGLSEADVRRKGEQSGTVRQIGESWFITFSDWVSDIDGNLRWKQVQRKVDGATSKRTAERLGYDQWVGPANGKCKIPQGLATVQQFIEVRFQPDHIDRLKLNGRVFYRAVLNNHVLPTLGGVQLREVTPQMVQQLVSAKLKAGKSVQTVTHIRNVVSAVFRHARALSFYTGMLPTDSVTLPQMTHAERRALTWDQVKALADAMPLHHRALIILLGQTGMRVGEACALRWRDVNLTDEWRDGIPPNALTVSGSFSRGERGTTKTGKVRPIPLTAESWVALQLHRERSEWAAPESPVFASNVGTPLDYHNVSQRSLKAAGRKLGLPWVSFHCLRHSAATMADAAGLTSAEKQKVLGHATAAMSVQYTHPELESVRARMETIQ